MKLTHQFLEGKLLLTMMQITNKFLNQVKALQEANQEIQCSKIQYGTSEKYTNPNRTGWNFISGLPNTSTNYDSICVVISRLTKSARSYR